MPVKPVPLRTAPEPLIPIGCQLATPAKLVGMQARNSRRVLLGRVDVLHVAHRIDERVGVPVDAERLAGTLGVREPDLPAKPFGRVEAQSALLPPVPMSDDDATGAGNGYRREDVDLR